MTSRIAIIVAGGKGLRMGRDLPKQYLDLHGKPILMRTIEAFYRYDASIRLIVVLPKKDLRYWTKRCKEEFFTIPHKTVAGGETRFESVRNGLAQVKGEALIAVHDGVRPLVTSEFLQQCFERCERLGAVIPVLELKDTLRQASSAGKSGSLDRSSFRLVQTPQIFRSEMLRVAYRQEYKQEFTDDASVVEAMGIQVEMIPGLDENIKITTPFDLIVAEILFNRSVE